VENQVTMEANGWKKHFAIVLTIGFLFISCSQMRQTMDDAYKRVDTDTTEVLNTKSFGNVEYMKEGSSGATVLVIHGIVGGYDQGVQTAKNILPESQKYISISRFGYLNSDLPEHPTPRNQCKAIKKVLEHNKTDSVVLLATSAGGTIAFRFALTYPELVKGMILIGSGYPKATKKDKVKAPPSFVFNDFFFSFFVNHMRGTLLSMFGISKDEYESAPAYEKEQFNNMMKTLLPIKPRKPGIINDNKVVNPDMLRNYKSYPIETIGVPVLIMHAKNDPMAKYDDMKQASKRLQNKKIISFDRGGHILFGHSKENRQYVKGFLDSISQ
jgi:pimeloyl-ACP methyl ester carboxylesterase